MDQASGVHVSDHLGRATRGQRGLRAHLQHGDPWRQPLDHAPGRFGIPHPEVPAAPLGPNSGIRGRLSLEVGQVGRGLLQTPEPRQQGHPSDAQSQAVRCSLDRTSKRLHGLVTTSRSSQLPRPGLEHVRIARTQGQRLFQRTKGPCDLATTRTLSSDGQPVSGACALRRWWEVERHGLLSIVEPATCAATADAPRSAPARTAPIDAGAPR